MLPPGNSKLLLKMEDYHCNHTPEIPLISKEISKLSGSKFAVIIDEAHSSQSGESTKSMKKVLLCIITRRSRGTWSLEEEEDTEDQIIEEMKARGRLKNVSFFAFNGNSKIKNAGTIRYQTTGWKIYCIQSVFYATGDWRRIHPWCLKNYTTYKTYWNLLENHQGWSTLWTHEGQLSAQTVRRLKWSCYQKESRNYSGSFTNQVMHRINNKAKAMIVTRSRLHAVHYKQIVINSSKRKTIRSKLSLHSLDQ